MTQKQPVIYPPKKPALEDIKQTIEKILRKTLKKMG